MKDREFHLWVSISGETANFLLIAEHVPRIGESITIDVDVEIDNQLHPSEIKAMEGCAGKTFVVRQVIHEFTTTAANEGDQIVTIYVSET